MTSILPRISMSELQRFGKDVLSKVRDYAVIQRHNKDIAFVLHPDLGRALIDSGMLDALKKQSALMKAKNSDSPLDASSTIPEMDKLIGNVLRELSRR
jgi:hypothetical protein